MSARVPRRVSALLALLLTVPLWASPAHADGTNQPKPFFGAFRLVKGLPDTPSVPQIRLPEGYQLTPEAKTQVASRAEYYSFVTGANNASVPVTVTWPGEIIKDVVAGKSIVPVTRDPQDVHTIHFALPVTGKTLAYGRNTLEIWSQPPTDPGVFLRLEHYDPDRAAGDYAGQPVRRQAAAAINQLLAAQAILHDSGLAAQAAAEGHFYALMGFETNNLVHGDYPAHWHFAYYQGKDWAAKAYLPHLLLDEHGRNIQNGQDVNGETRTNYGAGQPAGLLDTDGKPVAILTVRPDGGLDVQAGETGPVYSIVGDSTEDLSRFVTVLRDGALWLKVTAKDNTKAGELVVNTQSLPTGHSSTVRYDYDPLTGVLATTSDPDHTLRRAVPQPDRGIPPMS
ncbi:MAG TPA: hypothetical protein VHU91_04970 [Mycobacteriales bacterium]|nr:hypothetical protein [Mycobacteriales bacterium]